MANRSDIMTKCRDCNNRATKFWAVIYTSGGTSYRVDFCLRCSNGYFETDIWKRFNSRKRRDAYFMEAIL